MEALLSGEFIPYLEADNHCRPRDARAIQAVGRQLRSAITFNNILNIIRQIDVISEAIDQATAAWSRRVASLEN